MCEGCLNLSAPLKFWAVSGDFFNYEGLSCMLSVQILEVDVYG